MSPKPFKSLFGEVWKRTVPRVRLYRFRLPSRVAWLFPFLREYIPAPYQPEQLKQKALDQVLGREQAETEAEEIPDRSTSGVEQLPLRPLGSRYHQYSCSYGNPLACPVSHQTVQPDATCATCGFPALLPEKTELIGNRGRYQIQHWAGQRGWGRLYDAVQLTATQSVVVKEYLLPRRCFSDDEIRRRQAAFTRLAGLSLADGRFQDFRFLAPWDAIADSRQDRCYLVLPAQHHLRSLRQDLAEQGAMTPADVRQILNQTLQTLEFLHTQTFRLPAGQLQTGLTHGNLSLDTLLVTRQGGQRLVYLCDLALWEYLFKPTLAEPDLPGVSQDLAAVGKIAQQLLTGNSGYSSIVSPGSPDWTADDPALTQFVQRLVGQEAPFANAAIARQTLLQLPHPARSPVTLHVPPAEAKDTVQTPRWPFYLLGGSLLLLLGSAVWFLLPKSPSAATAGDRVLNCCFEDVAAVPDGQAQYAGAYRGTWSYVLQQGNLTGQRRNLEEELELQQPKLDLTYRPVLTAKDVVQSLQLDEIEFAIAAAPDASNSLAVQPIAYDGIAVFVAFSYVGRNDGLPEALQGRITLDQLRQLYTGRIQNWRELGGPNLPVRLYIPDEPETVRVFEETVLQTPQNIALFRRLYEQGTGAFTSQIAVLPTFDALRAVIRDFEDEQVGAIAFGTVSQVFGQCSVYPLAVGSDRQSAVQPIVQDNGQPITPATDLCEDKGSYQPRISDFQTQRYPLAYSLSVVYPRDNSRRPFGQKVAELLTTQEGQQLLHQAGLIPLQPLPAE